MSLIFGGAGSGKSEFAEAFVCTLPGERIYLATMLAEDGESLARIRRHRLQRAHRAFKTVECGFGLTAEAVPESANVLLEDLPNLLANEMFHPAGGGAEAVLPELEGLLRRSGHLTVVSGDVFGGGADYEGETLRYLHALARVNRALAAKADLVVELVCGLPNVLKGELP